jgi:hypothetical protein
MQWMRRTKCNKKSPTVMLALNGMSLPSCQIVQYTLKLPLCAAWRMTRCQGSSSLARVSWLTHKPPLWLQASGRHSQACDLLWDASDPSKTNPLLLHPTLFQACCPRPPSSLMASRCWPSPPSSNLLSYTVMRTCPLSQLVTAQSSQQAMLPCCNAHP